MDVDSIFDYFLIFRPFSRAREKVEFGVFRLKSKNRPLESTKVEKTSGYGVAKGFTLLDLRSTRVRNCWRVPVKRS